MDVSRPRVIAVLLGLLGTPNLPWARADTAVLPSGAQVSGSLQMSSGNLSFVRSDKMTELLPQQIEHVRFPSKPFSPLRAAVIHRITLRDGQRLTGELINVDQREVRF